MVSQPRPTHPPARLTLFVVTVMLLSVSPGYAHGVGYREVSLRAVPLEFFYSTGEKMSYREAKIFSPKDPKFAVQSGRTDEEGRFAFIPDVSGDWRVIVRDEEGHQCEAKITINDINNSVSVSNESSAPEGLELFMRALLGVSLIFNFALLVRVRRDAHK